MEENKRIEEYGVEHKDPVSKVESVIGWFGKAVALVKEYGVWNIIKTFLLIIVGILCAMTLYDVHQTDYIKALLEKQTQAVYIGHQEGAKMRANVTPQINNILLKLKKNLNADRVCIFEYHNGKDNPTNLPFMYMDMTYEEIADYENYMSDKYSNLSLSLYQVGYYVSEYGYFQGTTEELLQYSPRFANKLESDNTKYVLLISIHTVEAQIGFLCATWQEVPEIGLVDMFAKMSHAAQNLHPLLDYTQVEHGLSNISQKIK